jgi:uncharacterized protein YodC (DUF2158 family)
MAMSDFSIGDVVMLKSGGPAMTVHGIGDYTFTSPDTGLLCVWFDGAKRVEDVFHPHSVELYGISL